MRTQRVKAALRRIRPLLIESRKKDLNEADTRNRVERFLEDVLGYDLFKDVSGEEPVEHRAADYAIRINGKPVLIIEIKAIQTKLKDNHVFQVKNYAASKGVQWCVLTNAVEYRLYHIDFSEAVKHDIVFETNVVDDDLNDVAEKIYYITRRSMRKNETQKYWRRKRSLSEEGLLEAILSARVLCAIRRQLQRRSGQRISELDVARGLKRMFAEELYSAYEKLADKLQRKRRRRGPREARVAAPPPVPSKGPSVPPVPPAPSPKV